jgi:type II secretory pathway pseudopilin PulG
MRIEIIKRSIVHHPKGYTLVELLLYMGLLTIILGVMLSIFTSIIDMQIGAQATSNVAQDGRFIYTRLIYDINSADSVQEPADLGQTTQILTLTKDGEQYSYLLSSGNLIQSTADGANALNGIGTTVTNLSFQRIGNEGGKHTFQIVFDITARGDIDGTPETKRFQTTAGLR